LLQQKQTRVEQMTQTLYQELFPGSRLLPGRVRTQTKSKLEGLQSLTGGNDFAFLLVATAGLLKNQQATVQELEYREGVLTTVLTLNDFAHLDRLRLRLQNNSSIDVKIKQSGSRGDKVQARVEIRKVMS
jgi:type II secretory pathway component PulL